MLLRAKLALLLTITAAVAVASRYVHLHVYLWDKSFADVLSPVFAYLAMAIAWPRARPAVLASWAFAICFVLELFQLTGIPMQLGRERPWVRWLLGTSFSWHDGACYAIGAIAVAALGSRAVFASRVAAGSR
jgi:hypothetical protein